MKSLKKQAGFTIMELVFVVIALAILAGVGGLIYTVCHFINKFW